LFPFLGEAGKREHLRGGDQEAEERKDLDRDVDHEQSDADRGQLGAKSRRHSSLVVWLEPRRSLATANLKARDRRRSWPPPPSRYRAAGRAAPWARHRQGTALRRAPDGRASARAATGSRRSPAGRSERYAARRRRSPSAATRDRR